jgi:hypothetical protein
MKPESDIALLLAGMRPVLIEGEFVYAMVEDLRGIEPKDTLCSFQENEGTTLICSREYADRAGLRYEGCFRQITLSVHSSLQAVGFLAAVSGALARAGIPCNAVAAFCHDHLFIPSDQAPKAIEVLSNLSAQTTEPNQPLERNDPSRHAGCCAPVAPAGVVAHL